MRLAEAEPQAGTEHRASEEAATNPATALPRSRIPALGLGIVGASLATGAVLRFVAASPLWLDEALSVNTASLPPGEIFRALEHDGLPPLYYLLLHWWVQLAGDGDLAVRAFSGMWALAALPLAYLAGARLGGRRLGWSAVVLLALNPYAIRFATEARMYSMVITLVLVGLILVESARRHPEPLRLGGIVVTSGALLLTHYWAFWLVGGLATVLVLSWWGRRRTGGGRADLRVALATISGALLFLPWLPTFLVQLVHTGTPWASASRPTSLLATTIVDFGGTTVAEAILLGMGLAVLVLLGLFGQPLDGRRILLDLRTGSQVRGLAAVTLVGAAMGAAMSLGTGSAFAGRYAAVFFPLVILMAAAGLTRFVDGRTYALVLVPFLALGGVVSVHNARSDRTQAAEIAEAIQAASRSRDDIGSPVVAYCPDQLGPAVHRLLPPTVDQVVYPELDIPEVDSPERVDWYDYAERMESGDPEEFARDLLERAGPGNAIFLVHSSSYRLVEQSCDEVAHHLAAARGRALLLAEDPARFFEHAALTLFPAG